MIEIGKRDMLSFGKLDLDHFEANRTYVGLSLDEVIRDRPHIAKRSVLIHTLVLRLTSVLPDCLRISQSSFTKGLSSRFRQ